MNKIEEQHKELREHSKVKDQESKLANNNLIQFQHQNSKILFVGKFWKTSSFRCDTYALCKKISDTYNSYAFFDCVKFKNENEEHLTDTFTFQRNIHEPIYSICQEEISREEYEQVLEKLTKHYREFVNYERIVLIEKNETN